MQPLPLALLALVGSIISPSASVPAQSSKSEVFSSSSAHSVSSANGFDVSTSQTSINGVCKSSITVKGNGIMKKLEYPCEGSPQPVVINLNKTLLVGDKDNEYFSDTKGVLVHVTEKKCTAETFTKQGGKWTSKETPLDDKECEKIKTKIVLLKEEQEKFNQWYAQQQEVMAQQMEQLQSNIQNIFGGMFSGFKKSTN